MSYSRTYLVYIYILYTQGLAFFSTRVPCVVLSQLQLLFPAAIRRPCLSLAAAVPSCSLPNTKKPTATQALEATPIPGLPSSWAAFSRSTTTCARGMVTPVPRSSCSSHLGPRKTCAQVSERPLLQKRFVIRLLLLFSHRSSRGAVVAATAVLI